MGHELFEDDFDGIADGVEGSGSHASEQCLEFGEDLLDRVEVGAIRRQVEQMHLSVFEALADACHLVGRQVVDDDDAARHHFGDQAFLQPLAEDHAVHRAWQKLWGEDAVMDQSGDKGRGHPVTMGCFGEQLLALLTPAMGAGHRRVCSGLIDEHEAGEVKIGLARLPELARQGDIGPILLRRIDRFF